jgi:hypothetical protein
MTGQCPRGEQGRPVQSEHQGWIGLPPKRIGPSRFGASVRQPLDFVGSVAQRSRQLPGKRRAQQRAAAAIAGARQGDSPLAMAVDELGSGDVHGDATDLPRAALKVTCQNLSARRPMPDVGGAGGLGNLAGSVYSSGIRQCYHVGGWSWAHFGHAWAQVKGISANHITCYFAGHSRFDARVADERPFFARSAPTPRRWTLRKKVQRPVNIGARR